MKTNLASCLFVLSSLLFVASCTKGPIEIEQNIPEPTPDQQPEERPGNTLDSVTVVFTASHENVQFTKTNLTSDLVPVWVDGDAIGVYSSSDVNVKCELVSAEDGTFDASDIAGDAPYSAVYPHSDDFVFEGSVLKASVPSLQIVPAGQCVAPGALVAACVSSTNELAFKNCVSLMRLRIPAGIKSVVVEALAENEYLTGEFTMDMSASELSASLSENAAKLSTSVTLQPAGDEFASGQYYIAVLPTELSGLSFTFVNKDGDAATVKAESSVSLVRNGGVNFGSFIVYDITTPKELYDWAKSKAKRTPWDVVNLVENIDMSEYADKFIEAENFEGTFNGNGKTITGLTTPLFGTLYGSVTNLTLNSNISYRGLTENMSGHNQVVGVLAHMARNDKHEDAKVSNVITMGSITVEMEAFSKYFGVGGLVGGCNGILLEDCENKAKVEVKSIALTGTSSRILAGGLVGQSKGDASKLNRCKNTGVVSIASEVTSEAQSCAAGVVAYVDGSASITYCSNEGNISNSAAGATAFFTGGVVGTLGIQKNVNGASSSAWKSTFEYNQNSGSILDDSAYSTAVDHHLGGVVACCPVNGVKFKNLSNSGIVELASESCAIAHVGGLVGRFIQYRASTIQNSSNTGKVKINTDCASIYAGGLVGHKAVNSSDYKYPITLLASHNSADVLNNGSATTDMRLGGLLGNANYGAVIGALADGSSVESSCCTNSGSIISSSAHEKVAAIGGIVGQAANLEIYVYGAANTGDVSFTTSATASELYIAGICGISGKSFNLIDCISNCTISAYGNIGKSKGAAMMGWCKAKVADNAPTLVIKNCEMAGMIFGNPINEETLDDYLCACYSDTSMETDYQNNSVLQ